MLTLNTKQVGAVVATAAGGLIGWVGLQFAPLPAKVTTLETQRKEDNDRMTRIEGKVDKVLELLLARSHRKGL